MENKDFAVFILTNGRPDNVKTYSTLIKYGYTGKVYFIVDNEDSSAYKYIQNFGIHRVMLFDKKEMLDEIDRADNFNNFNLVLFARNICFKIAKDLGIKYFMQLDDDYTAFEFRIDTNSTENCGDVKPIKNLDRTLDLLLNYYKTIPALSIAFAQGGDFIGGINNGKGAYRFNKRKCMNTFLCSTDRPFKFTGSTNEDVNTYTILGSRGELFLTIPFVSIVQTTTQKNKGGLTDIYMASGTYIKSFYSILMHPSSIKVAMMNAKHTRLHHSIKWINTTPQIIDYKYKKL